MNDSEKAGEGSSLFGLLICTSLLPHHPDFLALRPGEFDDVSMWYRLYPIQQPCLVQHPGSRRRRGFTLLEAALAIIIVGLGVVAAAELLAVGTGMNKDAHKLTTGMNLAVNAREMVRGRAFDELLALDGTTYSPAVDARGETLEGLEGWTQTLTVNTVDPNRLTMNVPLGNGSQLCRLRVQVSFDSKPIHTGEWLIAGTE